MRTIRTYAVDPLSGRPLSSVRTVRSGVDEEPVPDGTVKAVLKWVGYDPDRAKAAIVAEHSRGTPRKSLLTELSERTG